MAKRGRPQWKPTAAIRRTVEEMRSCGESEATIARSLGIDADTLRKHCADELDNGFSHRRREVIGLLYKSARGGNVTAQKRLEEMTRLAGAAAEFDDKQKQAGPTAPQPVATRSPKRGKKEVQREDAFHAGTNSEWGEDLAPIPGTKPN
ncbi:hypothetical protein [Mesorhizobium sp. B2-6-1]|uniref:hypothetical protein n=1 Tax=Mesorhizobium sp. B2-6-1 TaxID=2589916 RepID=UPI001129D122|nr:hypothetical protein [Mesorhizobium sp. B2-6-1]TPJ60836.1 hypothetical protein FJ443_20050 [Mesorhizobium sp. B2-6-1]